MMRIWLRAKPVASTTALAALGMAVLVACSSTERRDSKDDKPIETPSECRAVVDSLRQCLQTAARDPELVKRRTDALGTRIEQAPPRTEVEREQMRQRCVAMMSDIKEQCR